MFIPYKQYITSNEWREKATALKKKVRQCEICEESVAPLFVHHLNYARLGNEHRLDLMVVCDDCHKKIHFSRAGNFYNDGRIYERAKKLKRRYQRLKKKK